MRISLRHRFLHWIYALLSWLPDIRQIDLLFTRLALLRGRVLGWQPNKEIGKGVAIWRGCHLPASARLRIGDGCVIKEGVAISGNFSLGAGSLILAHTKIDASGGVRIGSGTHVGRANVIFSHNHDISRRDVPVLQAPEIYDAVEIGDDAMLFSQVAVMPGARICQGAVIAFGSVVTGEVEAYGIYAGAPARKIGSRE